MTAVGNPFATKNPSVMRGFFCDSQWDVRVLFPGRLNRLVFQHLKGLDELFARVPRMNHLIHIAAAGGVVRMGKQLGIFRFFLRQFGCRVVGRRDLLAEDDFGSSLGTHHCNFRSGPCKDKVSTDVA